ncbi:MAG: CHAT domain-containing protein, partial [Victivallales bacterium]|nr:CHAT domain-containing protein [Victivallales bacterium]
SASPSDSDSELIENTISNDWECKEDFKVISPIEQLALKDRISIITALLEADFYDFNERMLRQKGDLLLTCLAQPEAQEIEDKTILFAAWQSLGRMERHFSHLVDAENDLAKAIGLANEYNFRAKRMWLEVDLLPVLKRQGKDVAYDEIGKRLTSEIDAINATNSDKADFASFLAMYLIYGEKWDLFDGAASRCAKFDEIVWANRLTRVLARATDSQDFSAKYYIHIAKTITEKGISSIPNDRRALIFFFLSTYGDEKEASRWYGSNDGNRDFLTDIIFVETLGQDGRSESLHKAYELLDSMDLKDYSLGENIDHNDAECWILNDKLGICIQLNRIELYEKLINELVMKRRAATEDFEKYMGPILDLNIGSAYILLGKASQGVPLLINALPGIEGNPVMTAMAKMNLGMGYMHLGDMAHAEQELNNARLDYKEMGNNFLYVRASVNYALALTMDGETISAEKVLEECLETAIEYELYDDLARIYQFQFLITFSDNKLTRQEKINKANQLRKKCLDTSDNPTIIASFFAFSATEKAKENFPAEDVLDDIESYFKYQALFSSAIVEDTVFQARDMEMKELLFVILDELNDISKIDFWNKYFEKKLIREAEHSVHNDESASTQMQSLIALVIKAEEAEQIIALENSKPEEERDKGLIQKALSIKREIEQNFDNARKSLSPEINQKLDAVLADNFVIHPDSLGQLSSVLDADTACLQYVPLQDRVLVFMATHEQKFVTSVTLKDFGIDEQGFSKLILKSRAMLQSSRDSNERITKILNELYQIVFPDELLESLNKFGIKKLIVNSSGLLRYLPFAALFNGEQYLVEKFQITNVTGIDLIRLARSSAKRNIQDIGVAVFADPDATLANGRLEGENIANLFEKNKLYIGDEATLSEFESLLGNLNFIHLATHAVLDPTTPGNSYILFANGEKWHYADMMGFNVKNVDSIVLSACSTAVSEKSTGGEIEGMAYQLLRKSPSGSVLASFWPVDDAATARFMAAYYTHIVDSIKANGALDRGGALREAQLKLLADPATSHPYYWAAFTLFGDFR